MYCNNRVLRMTVSQPGLSAKNSCGKKWLSSRWPLTYYNCKSGSIEFPSTPNKKRGVMIDPLTKCLGWRYFWLLLLDCWPGSAAVAAFWAMHLGARRGFHWALRYTNCSWKNDEAEVLDPLLSALQALGSNLQLHHFSYGKSSLIVCRSSGYN